MEKELLFKPRLPEADMELEVGTIRVRGLTRAEAMIVQNEKGTAAIERKMLHFAMLDPEVTEAEAGQWQKASPVGELETVTKKTQELSGMLEAADKAAYKSDGEES